MIQISSPCGHIRTRASDCLIGRVIEDEHAPPTMIKEHRRLFATALVISAGIDLLVKFHAGEPGPEGVGRKFKAFVNNMLIPPGALMPDVVPLAGDIIHTGVRNPLTHSFGLPMGGAYEVVLEACQPARVSDRQAPRPNSYHVNLSGLYKAFISSITTYRASLSDPENEARFLAAFPTLGVIAHGNYEKSRSSIPGGDPHAEAVTTLSRCVVAPTWTPELQRGVGSAQKY